MSLKQEVKEAELEFRSRRERQGHGVERARLGQSHIIAGRKLDSGKP